MIFAIIQQLFAKIFRLKQDTFNFEQEILRQKKRALFHQKIPNLMAVKQQFGDRYVAFLNIFNQFDPIKKPSLKDNPYKYELIAGTLLFQLQNQKTPEQLHDLIYLECSLWFGHQYHKFSKRTEFETAIAVFANQLKP